MAKAKKRKFYVGEEFLLEEKEYVDKAAQRITATPLDEVIDQTNLTPKEIRQRYYCFEVDGQTWVNF